MRTLETAVKAAAHLFLCLNVITSTTFTAFGQSIKPPACNRPTVTPPAAFAQTPVNLTLPSATTINVRLSGAAGNGSTDDSSAIQSMIDSHPDGVLYFPLGLYRLHNNPFSQPGSSSETSMERPSCKIEPGSFAIP